MLALVGRNPMGNVLHVIMGPETDFFTDIHGAKILDVTDLLNAMDEESRVFLSVTRCDNEGKTEGRLKSVNAHYLSSFAVAEKCDNPDCPEHGEAAQAKQQEASAPPRQKKTTERKRCYYCHEDKELLPIPGFRICTACAQIELGLKSVSGDNATTPKKRTRKKKDTDKDK